MSARLLLPTVSLRFAMQAITDVVQARELLWNLTLRELRTKYRRSVLGWTWSLLNPLATLAIYGFVFGVLFGASAPVGENSGLTGFAWFLLCAILPWNFFAVVNNVGLTSISSNSGLVRRVAFPREVLVFSNVVFALVQFGIELAVLTMVLLVVGAPVIPWIPAMIVLALLLTVFAAGLALALSALAVFFKDLTYLWAIVLQVWFFITPVVYPPSVVENELPEWAQNLLRINPMVHFVGAFRDVMYHSRMPGLDRIGALVASSAISICIGWMIFRKLSRRLPEEV